MHVHVLTGADATVEKLTYDVSKKDKWKSAELAFKLLQRVTIAAALCFPIVPFRSWLSLLWLQVCFQKLWPLGSSKAETFWPLSLNISKGLLCFHGQKKNTLTLHQGVILLYCTIQLHLRHWNWGIEGINLQRDVVVFPLLQCREIRSLELPSAWTLHISQSTSDMWMSLTAYICAQDTTTPVHTVPRKSCPLF